MADEGRYPEDRSRGAERSTRPAAGPRLLALAALLAGVLACGRDPASSVVFLEVSGADEWDDVIEGEASGVLVREDGVVLTCFHSLFGEPDFVGSESGGGVSAENLPAPVSVTVSGETARGKFFKADATVLRTYPRADLAVVKLIEAVDLEPADLAGGVERGEAVRAVGYPLGSEASYRSGPPEVSVRRGAVTAVRRNNAGRVVVVEHSAPLDFGMSGGGLFDADDRLVGVNAFGTPMTFNAVGRDIVATVLANALEGAPLDYRTLGIRDNASVCLLDPANGAVTAVVATPLLNHRSPAWSPDGRTLAFEAFRDERNEVYLCDLDTREERKLTRGESGSHSPSWSRDGAALAVTAGNRWHAEIELLDVGGNSLGRLTAQSGFLGYPSWAPDGRRLCAVRRSGDGSSTLVVVDRSTGQMEDLAVGSRSVLHPSWSPGGRKIAFSAERKGNRDIFVFDVISRRLERVTSLPGKELNPSWHPDGKSLLFTSAQGSSETHDVYSVSLGSGRVRRLTTEGRNCYGPVWSPEGDRIAFYRMEDASEP